MVHQQNHHVEDHYTITKQTLWSQLTLEFEKYTTSLKAILLSKEIQEIQPQSITQHVDALSTQIKNLSECLQRQVKMKLADFLFKISVNESLVPKLKNQIKKMGQQNIQLSLKHQHEMKQMTDKITELQTLVKVYQRCLINSQKNLAILKNHQKQPKSSNLVSGDNKATQSPHIFKIIRTLDMRFQPTGDANSLQLNNLSSSQLTSPRMRSIINSETFKDKEHNWNKSINLSSKSIYSANKQKEKSIRKEDKIFMKTHRQSHLSRSQVKESPNIRSIGNKENKLYQSTVSEFTLHKN